MGSVGSVTTKVTDVYFKTDWEEGTGPNSASFKYALAAGKRWMDRGYSFNELVESASTEYYLNRDEMSLLSDKLKIYAVSHGYYTQQHSTWEEELKRRKIPIIRRRTKIERELETRR